MTLQFLQTARYNAVPKMALIDKPAPKPQFDSLDALIAEMEADAKAIRKRQEQERPPTQEARGPVAESRVYDFVKDNPGATIHQVADHFKRETKSIASLLSRMEERGTVNVTIGRNPATGRPVRCFTVAKQPEQSGVKKSPIRDMVEAFIRANPGCLTAELAAHMGCSNKSAADKIATARKALKIRSERTGRSNNAPMRHWLEEGQ